VRQRLKADKERSHDRSYNRRKFHGPELPREPARCSRNWLVRLTFSSPASTLWGTNKNCVPTGAIKSPSHPGSHFHHPRPRSGGTSKNYVPTVTVKSPSRPTGSTWPRRQSSLPNCGAWLAHLPLTKAPLARPVGHTARWRMEERSPGFLWLALVFSFALDHLRRSKGGMIALARTGDDTVEHVFYYTVHGYMQSDTDAASSWQKANV
jgi:hypothetical protein